MVQLNNHNQLPIGEIRCLKNAPIMKRFADAHIAMVPQYSKSLKCEGLKIGAASVCHAVNPALFQNLVIQILHLPKERRDFRNSFLTHTPNSYRLAFG